MTVGVSVAATIPIIAGALGFGIIKGIKSLMENHNLDQEKYDPFWERPLEEKK